jgi:hypothetical protein
MFAKVARKEMKGLMGLSSYLVRISIYVIRILLSFSVIPSNSLKMRYEAKIHLVRELPVFVPCLTYLKRNPT